jgi:hypothetical protein
LNEIGDWVLDEALRVVAHRRADGDSGLTVAVNVAGRQLADPLLTERVTAALRRHHLPPTALKLEITESAMMQDDVFVAETVTALFDAGVLLSMDDFGTGFSSLSYLRQLPVCEVKIDRSFVGGHRRQPCGRGDRPRCNGYGARAATAGGRRRRRDRRAAGHAAAPRGRPRAGMAFRSSRAVLCGHRHAQPSACHADSRAPSRVVMRAEPAAGTGDTYAQ